METLDAHLLFRVAGGATADAVPTIARLASLSRAFDRLARTELWPLYCLARAADQGDAEAVVSRLVREAGSSDAPRNAASSLARCLSSCPGMAHACSAALNLDGAARAGGGGWWDADEEASEEEIEEEGGDIGGEGCDGAGESSGCGEAAVDAAAGDGGAAALPDAAPPADAGTGCECDALVDAAYAGATLHTKPESPPPPTATAPPPVAPHLDPLCPLSAHLASQLFRPDCFLPSPHVPAPPSPPDTPGRTLPCLSATSSPPPPQSLLLGKEEGKGEGQREGGAQEVGGGSGEGAAVVMGAKGCGTHWAGGEHCFVLRGAVAGFKQSRFSNLLQGQPVVPDACPICHHEAWNATALLRAGAHTELECNEGDLCCFICSQGHLIGLYKSRRRPFDMDGFFNNVEFHDVGPGYFDLDNEDMGSDYEYINAEFSSG